MVQFDNWQIQGVANLAMAPSGLSMRLDPSSRQRILHKLMAMGNMEYISRYLHVGLQDLLSPDVFSGVKMVTNSVAGQDSARDPLQCMLPDALVALMGGKETGKEEERTREQGRGGRDRKGVEWKEGKGKGRIGMRGS